ncbi:MAG: hypothetical protein K0R21_858, partial [Anaerocolumna sp.]|nr:hypothetical protein [Anaerocolumna sp.]MDF2952239.1 hypothetical protein [Anaerocolumna sp.]
MVVATTTIITGPNIAEDINPIDAPLLATINATSPLETM